MLPQDDLVIGIVRNSDFQKQDYQEHPQNERKTNWLEPSIMKYEAAFDDYSHFSWEKEKHMLIAPMIFSHFIRTLVETKLGIKPSLDKLKWRDYGTWITAIWPSYFWLTLCTPKLARLCTKHLDCVYIRRAATHKSRMLSYQNNWTLRNKMTEEKIYWWRA